MRRNSMKPTIIGIAGGTASGKTTIAKRLYEEANKLGSVVLIFIASILAIIYSVVSKLMGVAVCEAGNKIICLGQLTYPN